jgi:undecaprenyl-diphosphatase
MLENAILGIIQGIAEWLPVSSEGLLVLAKTHLFSSQEGLGAIIRQALFLHFGTFLAALIYFRKDVLQIIKGLFQYKSQSKEIQNLICFLLIATLISGLLGLVLIKLLSDLATQFTAAGRFITLLIGFLLLATGYLELKARRSGYRTLKDLKIVDSIILGIVQGFSALPGLSRSGLTVSALLLRKFDESYALKLSFLLSLPIVLAGNIILNFDIGVWSMETLTGLFFSFIFGLATIHALLKIARRINFGYFVLLFGILTILSTLIS